MEFSKEELNKVRLKKDGVGIHEIPLHFDLLELQLTPDIKKWGCFEYNFVHWGNTDDARKIARNKIIRYINFMYSKEITCIKLAYPDTAKRKAACAILAGFEHDSEGNFEKNVSDMLQGGNPIVNYMIVTFCRHNYDDKFSSLMTFRDKLYEAQRRIRNDATAGLKEMKDLDDLAEIVEKREAELLSGDIGVEITAALIKKMEEESLGLRPEDIAFAIKEGRDPLDGYDFYREEGR